MKYALVIAISVASPTFAQDSPAKLPPNTIQCEAFKKQADGTWRVEGATTFDVGNLRGLTLRNQEIGPNTLSLGDTNVYVIIERKCGGTRS